jgi:hypothetical protein
MVSSLTKMYILYWLTLFFPANLHIFIWIKHNQTSISFWIQGKMAHISVPKKLEKQFRPSITQGSVYMFANLIAVDTKQKAYIYHHQDYMLQFQHTSTVNRLQTRGGTIPRFAFNLCPFDQLPSKNIRSKPLIGISCPSIFTWNCLYRYILTKLPFLQI